MDMSGVTEPTAGWSTAQPAELAQTQADRLNKSLKYAGISHNEMAEFLEVHRNTIGGYVTGRTKMLPVIMRLWAAKTGVPLEWLRDGVWPEPEKVEKKPAAGAKTRRQTAVKGSSKAPAKR